MDGGSDKGTASVEQNASVTARQDVKGNRFHLRKDKGGETMRKAGLKGSGTLRCQGGGQSVMAADHFSSANSPSPQLIAHITCYLLLELLA